jgi:hypothetical protein
MEALAAAGTAATEATPSVLAKPTITTVTIERIGLMVRDLLAVHRRTRAHAPAPSGYAVRFGSQRLATVATRPDRDHEVLPLSYRQNCRYDKAEGKNDAQTPG